MRSGLLLAFAAALAFPVYAQPAAPPSDEAIVVEGSRRSIRSTLEQIIAETDSDQLARFEHKICPKVLGLPADWSSVVDRLIRENITSAGRETEATGCQPNAVAMFVDRPDDFVRGLYANEPSFFSMTPSAFESFAAEGRPAYSWQVTETYGSMGQTLRSLETLTYQDPNSGAIITTRLGPRTKLANDETGSRLQTGVREEIELSFVAIDSSQIDGLTLRQLADFATMHLLLDIKPDASARSSTSILSLFHARGNGAPRPLRMSELDWGALSGFYSQRRNNLTAAQQRQNIAATIARGRKNEAEGD